jgi:uncharacterized BrkB/YihY/UPF0761 family membrane protein
VADDIFFMAGAVAFNLVGATVPLLLLGVGISGYLLSAQVADPVGAIVALVVENLPQGGGGANPSGLVRTIVAGVLGQRSGSLISARIAASCSGSCSTSRSS